MLSASRIPMQYNCILETSKAVLLCTCMTENFVTGMCDDKCRALSNIIYRYTDTANVL